jgi:hypothetical protein
LEIGSELAKQRHQIIVGSANPDTVDRYLVEGANQIKRRTTVFIFHPEAGERREPQQEKKTLPFSDIENKLANIHFQHKPTHGTWHASHLQATLHAEAVVLISGAAGTEITGNYAFLLQKPLLPIPVFGGGAEQVWNKFKNLYSSVEFTDDENRYVFRVPDRGSGNPTPLGGVGLRHYPCRLRGWKRTNVAATLFGTASTTWFG